MMINCTLLVQAINFLIAYLMIKYLLLNPALATITEDDAAIESAHARLLQQQEAIIIAGKQVTDRLTEFKKTFLNHEPEVAQAFETTTTILPGIPQLPTIDQREIQTLAQEAAHKLIEEVAHVY